MADFVQTMKDWRRMCDEMSSDDKYNACVNCPLKDYGCPAIYETENASTDWGHIEKVVTAWATEHPEPVYPSIAKYLEQFGIIIRRDGTLQTDFFKANEPMSADIAQKLGIEPKEDA